MYLQSFESLLFPELAPASWRFLGGDKIQNRWRMKRCGNKMSWTHWMNHIWQCDVRKFTPKSSSILFRHLFSKNCYRSIHLDIILKFGLKGINRSRFSDIGREEIPFHNCFNYMFVPKTVVNWISWMPISERIYFCWCLLNNIQMYTSFGGACN